jgi:hypothetical protein
MDAVARGETVKCHLRVGVRGCAGAPQAAISRRGGVDVTESASEALSCEDREFALRDVEPTAVLWCEVEL